QGGLMGGKLWVVNVLKGQTHIIKLKKTAIQIDKLTETISTITLGQITNGKGDYELIDVRSEVEHKNFNIGGKNVPLADLENQLTTINSAIPIVFYCATGRRSTSAAILIKDRLPHARVYSLENGIEQIK